MRRLRILFCQQRFAPGKSWEALGETILKQHSVKACSADQVEGMLQSFEPHVSEAIKGIDCININICDHY